MVNLPLPFVISLFLLVLLIRLAGQRDRRLVPVIVFVGACTVLVTVVGVRWSFGWQVARIIQPIVACALPPLARVLFADLTRPRGKMQMLPHIIPVGLVVLFAVFGSVWRSGIDVIRKAGRRYPRRSRRRAPELQTPSGFRG
jgi:hypothetical protein